MSETNAIETNDILDELIWDGFSFIAVSLLHIPRIKYIKGTQSINHAFTIQTQN